MMTHIPNKQSTVRFPIVLLVITVLLPNFISSQESNTLANLEQDIARLIKLVEPSVVTVTARLSYSYVESSGPNILGVWGAKEEVQTIEYTNIGSGIVCNDKGHILTKASIVEDGHGLMVTFADGRQRSAEFLGLDRQTGLAVIKVDDPDVLPAKLGDSDQLKAGSWITIVGNSLGVSPAVSFGLVNSVRDDGMVQLSVDVSPGNAGSPIFNVHGQVVGILAARIGGDLWPLEMGSMLSGSEKAIAYPINRIKGLAKDIAQFGTRPEGWLGVTGDDLPGRPGLVLISGVVTSGPADKAGLRVGDLVRRIDGRRFYSSLNLATYVKSKMPGEVIVVDIVRGNASQSLEIIVEQYPEPTANQARRVLTPQQLSDPGIITTEWEFQSGINLGGEVSPEFLVARIHRLEHELEVLKALMSSQK